MTGASETIPEQRYGPTSGSVIGFLGLGTCAVIVGMAVLDHPTTTSIRVAIAAVGIAILVWAYLLRPRIIVEAGGSTLVLRNPLSSWHIPLAAVRVVGVKTVTTVKTEDRRFDAVAVGYSMRKVVRGRTAPASGSMPGTLGGSIAVPSAGRGPEPARDPRLADLEIQALMPDRILAAADRARALGFPETPIERSYAVPEIVLLGLTVLALVASYIVA